METAFLYPWIHIDDSHIDYHQKGSYVLSAWCDGPCHESPWDFMDMALSNLQGREAPGYCVCTMYQVLTCSRLFSNAGRRIDFIVDITPLAND